MRVIGLTGSIACGKSTVSSFLMSQGYPVIDGDRLSRKITEPGSPVLTEIYRCFGPEYFYQDGTLNRRQLGRLVFSDSAAREKLDTLMAPHLCSATQNQIESARASGAVLCFLDMPLLFEKGYDRLCDTVWSVWIPEKLQLARLMERDGYSQEEALSRIRAVFSSDEKARLANRVIDNSDSVSRTLSIVSDLLTEELGSFSAENLPRRANSGLKPEPVSRAAAVPAPGSAAKMPDLMERPSAAKSRRTIRKASWRMPVWLRTSLIVFTAFLLIGITSLLLMEAFLAGCRETHRIEQSKINEAYPLVYRDLIELYSDEYNLSPAFVSAIIRNESSFRSDAESSVGARGLMQLMPDTASWIAGKVKENGYSFERMYDPASNIRYGCWYLNYLSRLFYGDPVAVAAAYHAGQGQVKIWLSDPLLSEDGFTIPFEALPKGPTKEYVRRVTRDYGIYQKKYFTPDLYPDDPGVAVSDFPGVVPGDR